MTAKLLQTIKWKQRLTSIKPPIKPTAMKLAMTLQEANDTGFIHTYTHTHTCRSHSSSMLFLEKYRSSALESTTEKLSQGLSVEMLV